MPVSSRVASSRRRKGSGVAQIVRSAVVAFVVAVLSVVMTAAAGPALAAEPAGCGNEVPCQVADGQYFVYLPEALRARPDDKAGAIFFLHGHRGKAENEIRNKSFRALADELGVAFVAVSGLQGTWSFPTAPRALRDEPAFFDEVIADLVERFPVDRGRLMLSGFSSGAFMTWYLACDRSTRFAGYAPISGAFWEPLPKSCETPVPYLYHTHGTTDRVVPMAGRYLGGGLYKQGDVRESFKIWLDQAGLTWADGRLHAEAGLSCTTWTPSTGQLELCLHDGGHSVRAAWIKRAWLNLGRARNWQPQSTVAEAPGCKVDDPAGEGKPASVC